MRTIDGVDFKEKKVAIRVGWDVPLEAGKVSDDSRIVASVKTIQEVLEKGAEKIMVISHQGRPDGFDPSLILKPVVERMAELIGEKEVKEDEKKGYSVGERIYVKENIRFDSREQSKDVGEREKLAEELLDGHDIYINDAFSVVHRAEASIKEMAEKAQMALAGRIIEREVEALNRALNPEHPALCVLGGKKVTDKIPVLENMFRLVDQILLGGAAALPFLSIQGFDIRESVGSDEESLRLAREIWEKAGSKIILPKTEDLVWDKENKLILDIGEETIKDFKERIREVKTIIWNGPMGKFEEAEYSKGTFEIAKAIAESGADSYVGGGESTQALKESGVEEKITHLSTGGGATLDYLSGEKLPGLIPLGVYD